MIEFCRCLTVSANCISSVFLRVFGVCLILVIGLASFFGNLAVVLASLWNETLRVQTGNILIVYLSVIDMLTAVLVMLPSAISVAVDGWLLGDVLCKGHALFSYCFVCSSSANLAVISLDRFVAVVYPLQYPSWMTPKVMVCFCVYIFSQSTIVGFFCVIPDWIVFDYGEGMCALEYTTSIEVLYLLVIGSFFCFFTPATTMGVCNAMIIRSANKSKRRDKPVFVRRTDTGGHAPGQSRPPQSNDSDMRKTINSLLVVILTYYLCFSPYALTKISKGAMGLDAPQWWNFATTVFLFVASATNPFIYAILRKDYRNAFKKLPKTFLEKVFGR